MPLQSLELLNFESIWTKPKFWSHLLKVLKVKLKSLLTKYIATEQKQSILPPKFHEISLVGWNLVNFFKISQFLIKFCKSLKDLRKILLKWLGKTVKYWLNFFNFCSCTEKEVKSWANFVHNFNNVHSIHRRFSRS